MPAARITRYPEGLTYAAQDFRAACTTRHYPDNTRARSCTRTNLNESLPRPTDPRASTSRAFHRIYPRILLSPSDDKYFPVTYARITHRSRVHRFPSSRRIGRSVSFKDFRDGDFEEIRVGGKNVVPLENGRKKRREGREDAEKQIASRSLRASIRRSFLPHSAVSLTFLSADFPNRRTRSKPLNRTRLVDPLTGGRAPRPPRLPPLAASLVPRSHPPPSLDPPSCPPI